MENPMETRSRTAPIAAPAPPARRRRKWWILGAVMLVVLGAYWVLLGPQTISFLTHRKGAPTRTWPVAAFPPGEQPDLRIAVAGDVGEGEEAEWTTGWSMKYIGEGDRYDALLLLGDNVYPSGDPARLPYTVFRPFDPVLSRGAELYAIPGNHDAAHEDEQMADLGMPGTWWASHLPGDVLLIGLDSNSLDDPTQTAFLEDTLRTATERWKIVAIHESPYSAGYQGSNLAVRDLFSPIFSRYGVQLVLSGHDHDYQRSVPIDGVTYMISGAGGRTRGTGEESFTAASWSVLHYVDLNVWPDRILLRAVDQNGMEFDQVTIPV